MQVVTVDTMGPLSTTREGNRHVLVAGDYCTKWFEASDIPNQEASTVGNDNLMGTYCLNFNYSV